MIDSLTLRIFAIFWLTLTLVLMLVLMLLKLDSRQMMTLLKNEYCQGLMLEQHIEADLCTVPPNDLFLWRCLFRVMKKWSQPRQRLVFVTSEGRIFDTLQKTEMQIVYNFIGQSNNINNSQKKNYVRLELIRSFPVRDSEDNYQVYLIRIANSSQSDFINLLLARPLLLLIVTMLISTLLLLWLAWNLAKPARKLKIAADEMVKDNLRHNPELEAGPQEFLATGVNFDQMVSTLERIVTLQQRLLSDISHELRTPLTRLQLAIALLRRRQGENNELNRIETEAQRMDSMINDLLVLSRNQHKNELGREYIPADELWGEVLDDARFEAEQMGKTLEVPYPSGPCPLFGNRSALESAFENVVRNALRYSNTRISITFIVYNQGLIINVDDDGPGINQEDREQIFRPFYRTDEARDRASGGTGLGLAIVENIVTQHKGWVKAGDSSLGGLCLTIWLPLNKR